MTMFNKDQIFQLLESRDGEALRALWQGRGAVDIAALLDSVEDGARQAAVFRTLPKDLAADVFSYLPGPTQATLARSFADGELQQIAEQTALYKEMEKNLTEHAANVYIQDLADLVAVRKGLEGVTFYPIYVLDLSGIHYTA